MSTIECKALSFHYDGQRELFHNVNLSIDSSWKLGLIGRNGRGKTTFMKLLKASYKIVNSNPSGFDDWM